jgi:tripartite-type tricarboxylate transporter receptor subunit TctC
MLAAGSAFAQDYPTRPIRFIIPFVPGGSTDIVARLIGDKLSARLGQPVVIDNRGGAGGNIGADLVAKAPPDGHSILLATTGIMAINDTLYPKLSYSPQKDLAPVVYVASLTNVLAVNPKVPANSVQELIAYAKANPGKLNFASGGTGAATHLVGELFKSAAGVDIVHVPYKGGGQALQDLLSGEVSMMFGQVVTVIAQIQAGQLRPLGVTSAQRSDALPGVPTIAEAGVPGFEALSWSGIVVPAGTPQAIIDRLNREANAVLREPEIRTRFAEVAAEPVGGTPGDFARHIAAEHAKWSKVIKDSKIRLDE